MIRRWQKYLNAINRLMDMGLIALSLVLSVYLWLDIFRGDTTNIAQRLISSVWPALAVAALYVAIYQFAGVYDSLRRYPLRKDIARILICNGIGALIATAALYLFRLQDFSRGVLGVFFILTCVLVSAKRIAMRAALSYYRKLGYNQKHLIIVGGGPLAEKFLQTTFHYPRYGLTVDGYVGEAGAMQDIPCFGPIEDLERILNGRQVDEVILSFRYDEIKLMSKAIAATEKSGTKVSLIPNFSEYISSSSSIEVVGDSKLMNVRSTPLDFPLNAFLKRLTDIIGSVVLIVLSSPIMLAAAIGTKLSSPGPIIFKQERIGLNKKPFTMYKFRSMRVNTQQDTAWTKGDDPRKTKFGSFIRKTSIDEFPQFFNVLKGDMSLVGPRPEIPHFVSQFRETVPLYMLKHIVRPGITGWAQINGYRGDTSIEGRIRCDIWYVENWSLGLDLRILVMTALGGMINKEKVG